jgi:hypothetical protein
MDKVQKRYSFNYLSYIHFNINFSSNHGVTRGLLHWYITNSVAPEPEGSSPYSQKPATGPYPEPTGPNLHSPSQSP